MTRRPLPVVCACLWLFGMALWPAHAASVAAMPSLVPWPAQMTMHQGHFTLTADTPIVLADPGASTRWTGDYLAGLLARTRGLHLRVTGGRADAHGVVLQLDPQAPVAQAQGYALDVTPQGVRIRARSSAGLFYGAITLWQLATPGTGRGAVALPDVSIRDWPRFAWRGLMLDSARHFQSVADIERLLDQMAQLKLDVFHWHLTDDQGWRIQIKRYPELTRIGAWRTPPGAGTYGEPLRYGGFYTQQQIRQVVAYAAARHITIVPELDMPGHAQAAIASYPWLGVTGQRPPVGVDWGVNPWLYNVNDRTFTFIENVLDEVMALFPSKYIHLGGDEAIKDQWKASPAVRAKMKALGISNYDALQGWFMGRLGKYLAAHGRQMVGWDEILEGGDVPPDAVVMSWRGTDGAIAAAKAGHDVVLAPAPQLYFDEVQSDRADEYAGRLPVETLRSVYAFEPVPKQLDAAQAKHVLGAQANMWTEYMTNMAHVEHAVFPRLDALAEVDWSPAATRNWQGFLARLPAQFVRYREQHINLADSAFAPDIAVDRNVALASGTATVTLSNQTGFGSFRYTLDGRVPTLHSRRYTAPFQVGLPTTVRVASFAPNGIEMAAPRERVIDRANLLSRIGNTLPSCPGNSFQLRVQPMPDATSVQPVYGIDVFDACQMFPSTRMDGVTAIHIDVARLVRNYALAHDASKVIAYPHATPFGELAVHADRCDGPVLASLPLPDPAHSPRDFALHARLPAQTGDHALCLIDTAPIDGPLYGLGRVSLVAGKARK